MAPRRRPRRRARRSGHTLNFDFYGWISTDSGNQKSITAQQLSIPVTRAGRPLSLRLELDAVATTSTYMVPSNSPILCASILSARGDVVAFTKPTLIPHGSKTTVSLRAPRSTDFSQYSPSGQVIHLYFQQAAQNTTVSYSGSVLMQFTPHQQPYGVKLEEHVETIENMEARMAIPE